jgi:hypothetical protein
MPSVATNPAQYLQNLEQLKTATQDTHKDAENKLRQALQLLCERKEYVQQTIDARICFFVNPKTNNPIQPFISWYDLALDCRLSLALYKKNLVALLHTDVPEKHIVSFRCKLDITQGFTALKQALQSTRDYPYSILQMLGAIGFDTEDFDKITVVELYNFIVCSKRFKEMKDEKQT